MSVVKDGSIVMEFDMNKIIPPPKYSEEEWEEMNKLYNEMKGNKDKEGKIMKLLNADKMIEDTIAMKQVAEAIEIDGIIKYINENCFEEKTSEWILCKNWSCAMCSNCKARVKNKDVINNTHPYCYCCGARMKEYKFFSKREVKKYENKRTKYYM